MVTKKKIAVKPVAKKIKGVKSPSLKKKIKPRKIKKLIKGEKGKVSF